MGSQRKDHRRKEKAIYFSILWQCFSPAFWTRGYTFSFILRPTNYVQSSQNLQCFNLQFFLLSSAVKAIHIQQKPYFEFWEFWCFPELEIKSLILSHDAEQQQQAKLPLPVSLAIMRVLNNTSIHFKYSSTYLNILFYGSLKKH